MYGHTNPTIRSTDDGEQVGPKMHTAVKLAAQGPPLSDASVYPNTNRLATSVGPNGSSDFGYRIVNRCRSKNLLKIHPGHEDASANGKGAVVLTDKGAEYLNETEDMNLNPDEYIPADAWWSNVNEAWQE